MSKSKRKAAKLNDLATPALVSQGETLLSTQSYKEAIDVYKQLLKRESNDAWSRQLAVAYVERAKQLAAKGMYKEAAMLWDNSAALGTPALEPALYIEWLIRAGQFARAAAAYARLAADLADSAARQQLNSLLGLLLLTGDTAIAEALPAESALRQQLGFAQAALRAYCAGADETAIREALKNIGFRSPYREFRQTLSALIKQETDPAEAVNLLQRLPPESPYRGFTAILHACAELDNGRVRALAKLPPRQQALAAALLGLESPQLKLLNQWVATSAKPSPRALFDFIIANLDQLDRTAAQRACFALLTDYPGGLKPYSQAFGEPAPFDLDRLHALRAEREQNLRQALDHWQRCVHWLAKDSSKPDNPLAAALILRHMAQLRLRHEPDYWETETAVQKYLEQSLELDPDDQTTYIALARLHQQAGNTKACNRWVDSAVKRFPADSQILLLAMENATERKAFKKAVTYANKLLKQDPINAKARSTLIDSHVAHARKQFRAGKYPQAAKELDSAQRLERDGARSGVVEFNQALLASREQEPKQIQQAFQHAAQAAGSPLLARLRLAVEARRLGLNPADFVRYLPDGKTNLRPDRDAMLALVRTINSYQAAGVLGLPAVLEDLAEPVRKGIDQLGGEEDFLALCDCLHRVEHYRLLEQTASRALKRWPQRPLLIYYQIYGRARGNMYAVSDEDYQRLDAAWQQANAAEDSRTALLIEQFFNQERPLPAFPLPTMAPPPELTAALEQIRQDLLQVPAHEREAALDEMLDSMPENADGLPPELRKLILKTMLLPEGTEPPASPAPQRHRKKPKRKR